MSTPAGIGNRWLPPGGLSQFAGTLALVGAGKMGGAMLEGWIGLGVDPARIAVIEPQPAASIAALADRGLRINPDAASLRPDAVVIAVKPQIAPEIMPAVAALVSPATVVVSIMAGRTIAFLADALPRDAAVIRAMPNTPAAIGRGITVAVPNARVTPAQRQLADALLAAIGAVEWIDDEALMDAVTAVSGSGPAYVFLLAESLARAGDEGGPAGRARGAAGARDRRGLGRIAPPLAARCRDVAPQRHLAGRHHRGGARCADGGRTASIP